MKDGDKIVQQWNEVLGKRDKARRLLEWLRSDKQPRVLLEAQEILIRKGGQSGQNKTS